MTKKCVVDCLIKAFANAQGYPHHFDLAVARTYAPGENRTLVFHLTQIIALAYSAVTSRPVPLRLVGVQLLEEVVRSYGPKIDPDCEGTLLLEQSEAQVVSPETTVRLLLLLYYFLVGSTKGVHGAHYTVVY